MIRRFLAAVVAVASLAVPGLADDAVPARFFIERIEVRNAHRVSPEIVISETLLREGTEYSEEELHAASLRLSRLPYILSAEFSLAKGSDRGRHILVITIAETKPFFYLVDTRPILHDRTTQAFVDYADYLGAESNEAAIGYRGFIGRRGVVHVGVTSRRDQQIFTTDYSAIAAGYTRYDIFGTHAFATFNLRQPFGTTASGALSPQLVVGIPLTLNQTLTLDLDATRFERSTQRVAGPTCCTEIQRQDGERLVTATWTYNTTNQPFVPTNGTIVRIAPVWSKRDRSSYSFAYRTSPFEPPSAFAQHINGYGIDVSWSRYWELSDLHSISAGVQTGWASVNDRVSIATPVKIDSDPTYAIFQGSYSYNLWHGSTRNGDSRLELSARYVTRRRAPIREISPFSQRENVDQAAVSWVRRSSWGTLRLGLGYTWER